MTSGLGMSVGELRSGYSKIAHSGGQWLSPMGTGQGLPGGPSALPDVNPLGAELKEVKRFWTKARARSTRRTGGKGCLATGTKYPNI